MDVVKTCYEVYSYFSLNIQRFSHYNVTAIMIGDRARWWLHFSRNTMLCCVSLSYSLVRRKWCHGWTKWSHYSTTMLLEQNSHGWTKLSWLLYYYAIRAKCPSDAGSCSAFKDMDDTYVTHRLTVFFIIHLTVFIFRTDYGATYTGAVGLFPNYFPSIKKRSKTYWLYMSCF